jgi:dihydropteroate synthase-like protein
MQPERLHFVTGKLAEPSLRRVLEDLAPRAGFSYTVEVLNITVAALMTADWVAKRIKAPADATRVLLPGLVKGDLQPVREAAAKPVELGPKDLRDLPTHFGQSQGPPTNYGRYDIEILAEINHANRLPLKAILSWAERLRADGADLIDLGCTPGEPWEAIGETVAALREAGHRVSVDSFVPREVAAATAAGAELVLSVNQSNRDAAADWGCEVVVVPDNPATLAGLDATVELLTARGVKFRLDPVLEPIGFGFAASLARYHEVRRRYPEAEMMMGIGNLTELTDVDSAGVNVMLLAFCEEVGIRSVLTTEVINWARTSVRECDLARRLVYYAVRERVLPKHLEPRLVMLRDPRLLEYGEAGLAKLAAQIKDRNFRVFVERGELHLINAAMHLHGRDPFELFAQLLAARPEKLDASHAFYLGYELAKAVTALTLGKQYTQDEALDWGFLTLPERSGRHPGGEGDELL